MRFVVLALDYDGTLAEHGSLNEEVRTAIEEVRRHGLIVVLVTGRIIRDLQKHLDNLRLFDIVVGQNGAVILQPSSCRFSLLGQPPPAEFVERVHALGIDALAGECVVDAETWRVVDRTDDCWRRLLQIPTRY